MAQKVPRPRLSTTPYSLLCGRGNAPTHAPRASLLLLLSALFDTLRGRALHILLRLYKSPPT